MELITLIVFGLFILIANFLGYKYGKGEPIDLSIKKFKPILRTEEQEVKLIEKLQTQQRNK